MQIRLGRRVFMLIWNWHARLDKDGKVYLLVRPE